MESSHPDSILLALYASGYRYFTPEASADLRQHVAHCDSCAAQVEKYFIEFFASEDDYQSLDSLARSVAEVASERQPDPVTHRSTEDESTEAPAESQKLERSETARVSNAEVESLSAEKLVQPLYGSTGLRHLWVHQADVLRVYPEYAQLPNVSFALPTGFGKTWIALRIADVRRSTLNEEVLYLCTDADSLHAVRREAHICGISIHDVDDVATTGIRIATYSQFLNTRQPLSPDFLICDDADAADAFLDARWSIRLTREEPAYEAVCRILNVEMRASSEHRDQAANHIELIAGRTLTVHRHKIAELLDICTASDSVARHVWESLRNHLDACVAYVAADQLVIRPITPPTHQLAPFAGARQRLFICSTSSTGGFLERVFGVQRIAYLPTPPTQRHGQRVVFFPGASLNSRESQALAGELVKRVKPSLLVMPPAPTSEVNRTKAGTHGSLAVPGQGQLSGITTVGWPEALRGASRDCHLVAVHEFWGRDDLQQTLLSGQLCGTLATSTRILAKVSQLLAAPFHDQKGTVAYAIFGKEIVNVAKKIPSLVPPCALRTELEQALAVSVSQSVGTFLRLVEHGGSPRSGEASSTPTSVVHENGYSEMLRDIAGHEVAWAHAAWDHRYGDVLQHMESLISHLQMLQLKSDLSWWSFLAAEMVQERLVDTRRRSEAVGVWLKQAAAHSPTVSWFARVAQAWITKDVQAEEIGTNVSRKDPETVRRNLKCGYAVSLVQAIKTLGEWVGLSMVAPEDRQECDVVWCVRERLVGFSVSDASGETGSTEDPVTGKAQAPRYTSVTVVGLGEVDMVARRGISAARSQTKTVTHETLHEICERVISEGPQAARSVLRLLNLG